MARHGENIRKRSDGRWEGRYRLFDEEKGKCVYRSVYGRNYDEVKEKLCRAKLRLIRSGMGIMAEGAEGGLEGEDGRAVLFSQAAGEWLEEISGSRKYSTYVKYAAIYQAHLADSIGSCRLSIEASEKLREKASGCAAEGELSESLRRSIVCVVNQILAFADMKYSYCIPPLAHPSAKAGKKMVKSFSRAEQARILECIRGQLDRPAAAVLLCLHSGLRLGELCALRWPDIDFESMTLAVNQTVQRIAVQGRMPKTILLETGSKSESSRRTIPLAPEIMEVLLRFKEDRPYVFGGKKLLDPRTMQYRFKKILKEAGVDGRNFHALRHTFATNCMENGMDAKALSELLGHSDVRLTLNRYVHPTMDAKRKQIGALLDYYSQICGQ